MSEWEYFTNVIQKMMKMKIRKSRNDTNETILIISFVPLSSHSLAKSDPICDTITSLPVQTIAELVSVYTGLLDGIVDFSLKFWVVSLDTNSYFFKIV